jgi:hypothetical protein
MDPITEESTEAFEKEAKPLLQPSILTKQYSPYDGGVPTEMECPDCEEEITGSYLPVFKCPHCDCQIWRDNNGDVIHYEQNIPKLVLSEETKVVVRKYMGKAKLVLAGLEAIIEHVLQDKSSENMQKSK